MVPITIEPVPYVMPKHEPKAPKNKYEKIRDCTQEALITIWATPCKHQLLMTRASYIEKGLEKGIT